MLGYLLRALLFYLVVRAVVKLVGGLVRGLVAVPQGTGPAGGDARFGPNPGRQEVSRGTLVQDPVCGTYLPQDRALTRRNASGAMAFFCSEQCRSAYDAQAPRRG
ncbi:MAG TPA: hypothetical protein VMF13_16420 [Luteitalea sp.]|nr:hypothetical protein [Luteitalea sp.]